MTRVRHLVIGGGPAAAATAVALVGRGLRVTVVDAGLRLEPERAELRRRLAATSPGNWSPSDLEVFSFAKEPQAGLGQKRLFGSDFPFANPGLVELAPHDVGARPSFAAGGLSNVWGAGLLPYTEGDLKDWPLDAAELAPHYRALAPLLPLSAEDDDLSEQYPLFKEPDGVLMRSEEGDRMLNRLRRNAGLRRGGWRFGAARLAVRAGRPAPEMGCVYCSRCLDGCPYGHIYNAADTLDALAGSGAVDYRGGLRVASLTEGADGVRVEVVSVSTGESSHLEAERVYLGAGALSSTFILQRSGLLGAEVELLDSQTVYLPMLWAGSPAPKGERDSYSLAQAYALLDSPAVSSRPIHLSLYGYSPDLPERVRDLRPQLARLLGPLLERATRQLVFAICFLHSDESSRFVSRHDGDTFSLEARANPAGPAAIRRLKRRLLIDFARVGMLPLTPAAEIAKTGGGYHYGGSVPMRKVPSAGESDLLGRPYGSARIHVVDASCFPSIPGGTITYSIMANAHRIASATFP